MLLTNFRHRTGHVAVRPTGAWLALSLGVVLGLTGCGTTRDGAGSRLASPETLFGLLKPYRMEVVQGNVVTQEVMAQIQPGLGRAQVRDILGTPLLSDVFHENRWDYVFTIARQGVPAQQRRVTIFFKDNVVERFEADSLPTEREFVASITREQKLKKPAPDLTPEQIAALPVPAKTDAGTKVPQGAARDYPPLEAGTR